MILYRSVICHLYHQVLVVGVWLLKIFENISGFQGSSLIVLRLPLSVPKRRKLHFMALVFVFNRCALGRAVTSRNYLEHSRKCSQERILQPIPHVSTGARTGAKLSVKWYRPFKKTGHTVRPL